MRAGSFRNLGAAVLMLGMLAACGGDGNDAAPPPPPPPPTVTLGIAPVSGAVTAGQSLTITATIVRGGSFAGTVTIGAIGAPAGVTVTGGTIAAGATTQVVTIATTAAAAPGTVNLGITGTATGVTIAPASFALTITAPPPAVASVEVTPATSSLLAGVTVQLAATPRDAAGDALTGRTITWSSSDGSIASVSSTGLVTTLAPGNATISATVESQQGTAAIESVNPKYIPVFQRPFDVDFEVRTTNYHDHDVPREFVDNNGRYIPYWGEPSLPGIDGHSGYDWRLPVGTPLLAVAAGRVVSTGTSHAPFYCPLLDREVTDGHHVRIQHDLPGDVRVVSYYAHFSQIHVTVGEDVAAGQIIGLSGNTGCSLNPHLHFEVRRLTQLPPGVTFSIIDSYGWDGPGPDPWTLDPEGADSIYLWKPGEAPTLFRSVEVPLPDALAAFVRITWVRFQGVRDVENPNNEYLEVTFDTRAPVSTLNIGDFYFTTRAGDTYTFPSGTVLTQHRPSIRVHTGPGTNTDDTLYWGRAAGVYDNLAECVRFYNTSAQLRNQVGWGGGCAP